MNVKVKSFTYKVVRSGCVTEVYSYKDEQIKKGDEEKVFKIEKKTRNKKMGVEESESYARRLDNIKKTKRKITRLINANVAQYKERDKFITLTFRNNEDGSSPDRKQVVDCFDKFTRRLKYKYGNEFAYLAVIERGEKSTKRLHLHIVYFGLPFIDQKELELIWEYGRVDIKKIESSFISNYLTKYIEKTIVQDNYIEKGKKFYFTSKNLKKPCELFYTVEEMEDYLDEEDLGVMAFEFVFDSQFIGECSYAKFLKYD